MRYKSHLNKSGSIGVKPVPDDVVLSDRGQAIADVAFRAMERGTITWMQCIAFRDTLAKIGYAK